MRQLSLLLLGIVLISAALGAFAYRQMVKADQVVAVASGPESSRTGRTVLMRGSEVSYPIDESAGRPVATSGQARHDNSSIEMFNFIFNLLNVIVGTLGVWFAGMSMRGVQPGPGPDDIARAA